MAIAFSIFLTLCTLAVTYGEMPVQHEFVMPCASLTSCIAPLAATDFSTGAHYADIPADHVIEFLDNYCQNLLPAANTCVTRETPNCHRSSFVESARNSLLVGAYICRPENRDQMISVLQSDCVTNATVGAEIGNEVGQCTNEYLDEINAVVETYTARIQTDASATLDLCPCLDNFRTCLVARSSEMCGEHVGGFFGDIMDMAMERVAPPILRNCFEEHSVSTRAVRSVMPLFGVQN